MVISISSLRRVDSIPLVLLPSSVDLMLRKLGLVYTIIFFRKVAELIQKEDSGQPEFHMVYTTTFHGPFKINLKKYGYSTDSIMPNAPKAIKEDKAIQKN